MLLSDPARPRAGEHVLERLRLADTAGRIPQRVVDQAVDPLQDLLVRLQPMGVVVPAVRGENESHSSRLCSSRSPDRACCKLSSNRLALAGTRSRYAVSASAAYSSAEINTAFPRREVISIAMRSLFTCSISGNSCLRASLAAIDMVIP